MTALHPCTDCGAESYHRVLVYGVDVARPADAQPVLFHAVWRCPIHKRAWRRPRRRFQVLV